MFSPKNVICRRSLWRNSVRDYLLSVFFHQKGSKFTFKVAHSSWFGDTSRPEEEGRLLWIQKNKGCLLFICSDCPVLSNQLYYSHWWTSQGCWNVLGFFPPLTLPKTLCDCLCLAVTSKCCNSMKSSMQLPIREKQQLFWPFTVHHHRLRNVFNWTPVQSVLHYLTITF